MYRISGEYPAIYGWDLGDIHKSENLDNVSFTNMIVWIREVHRMGGINTISWHMDNPVSGASSWDKSQIAKDILPGGPFHDQFNERLDMAAKFLRACKIDNEYIPIIFRPYHEHNGGWFWWGKGNMSEEDYVAIFRYTVDYFRNHHDLHHLIIAFSPDRSRMIDPQSKEEYLYAYPGDDYVDLLGLDNYADVQVYDQDSLNEAGIINFVSSLEMLTDLAQEKGKPSALTETGSNGIKDEEWFSKRILEPIKSSKKAKRISYILFWRNHDKSHHFMAYPEHPAENDFERFIDDPLIFTLNDIGHNFTANSFSILIK